MSKRQRKQVTGISRLHYITHPVERKDYMDLVRDAVEAGCDWIQLRTKDLSENKVYELAREAVEYCRLRGVTLIVNDWPHVALATGADGVHLGADDMDPEAARDLLGEGFVIGATANTLRDLERAVAAGVDYVGLGPFRLTETKEKLSPVLGLEGYRRILIQARIHKITVPVVAVGGILLEDVRDLLHTGLHGIAMAGLISRSPRKAQLVGSIHRLLEDFTANSPYGTPQDRR